jgi:serine/threonine-protein kinase
VDIDYRADIYSLGATFYHLVTGRPPFDGETPSAVMHKHLKQPLVPPDHLNTSLSAGIGEVIEVAMAKNREERYASMEDMLEDLRALRAGNAPIHARQQVDLDQIAQIEENAQTVDIDGPAAGNAAIWSHPVVITLLIANGITLIAAAGMLIALLAN